jgi:DNA-binding XRE family transcriptional regulator
VNGHVHQGGKVSISKSKKASSQLSLLAANPAPNIIPPNRVKELRENRWMTQEQLARRAKVSLRTIHSVEKGNNCRMTTKRGILLAFGVRLEDKDYVFSPPSAKAEGEK